MSLNMQSLFESDLLYPIIGIVFAVVICTYLLMHYFPFIVLRKSIESAVLNHNLCSAVIIVFVIKKQRRHQRVVLTGCTNSGKTVLFTYLLYGKIVETYMSMRENVGLYKNKKVCYNVDEIESPIIQEKG